MDDPASQLCDQCGAALEASGLCMACPEEMSFGGGELDLDTLLPIPGYQLESELGRGGQGVVFRAIQKSLGRAVAIKVLHPRFLSDRKVRARFRKEAQLLAGLSHENVVSIIDRGSDGPIGFLVMELIEGETLQQTLKREMPSQKRALAILDQVAAGLDYCHERGMVIRDLKPANLLVNARGVVKIADFGLAKVVARVDGDTDTEISRSGQAFGTPRYMSPEQARAEELDHRTDLYSFGLIAYEVLTGPLPLHHLPAASERGVDLPVAVDRVVTRMLDPLPGNRYQSAGEFVGALRAAIASVAPPASVPVARGEPGARGGAMLPDAPPPVRSAAEVGALVAGALLLGALTAGAAAPRVEPLAAPQAVWTPGEGDVVARFTLPGPWWLRAHGEHVLALATDSLSGATWLARFGPEAAQGVPPVVERFPLDPVAAELSADGASLLVTGRDGAVSRVDLKLGLTVEPVKAPGPRPGLAQSAGTWTWRGWAQALVETRAGQPDGRTLKVPDGAPGPLAVDATRAVMPAAAGVAVVPLDGGAIRRIALPLPDPITALVARPGQIWVASRHGDSVVLLR